MNPPRPSPPTPSRHGSPEAAAKAGDKPALGMKTDASSQLDAAGKTLGLDKPLQGPATYSMSSLSLPRGGGAMKAIAEAFRANPATGTGSMSIPLAVTPARGLEPSLALAYDSGSGNGPVGLGWSLSTGSISRRTDKGLPRYDGADTFLFEGEELVPSLALVGDVWVPEAVTPPSGWDIVRYRPRIEGAFSRIERWTDTATGDVLWKVRDRTNVLRVYGRSAAARLADPSDARKVFSWLLEEVLDDRGNRVVLRYAGDDASRGGVDALSDVARRTSLVDFVQRYPLVVRYGNATPHSEGSTDDDFLFAVVFDWGGGVLDTLGEPGTLAAGALDATASEAALLGSPPVRADAFSLRRAGFDVRTRWLCSAVRLYHAIDTDVLAPASPWVPVRTWSMTYDDADHLQKLVSVVLTGHRDGDSLSMPATTFTYQARVLGSQVQTLSDRDAAVLPRGVDGRLYRWQDLDGEGLVGLLTEQGGAWWYQRNQGDPARWDRPDLPRPRLGPLRRVTPLPNASLDGGAQLVDLDGDGRAELVVRGEGSQTRMPDARHGWGPFRRFRHMPNVDWSDPNLRFIDLTGDGKADLLLTEERVFRWYPSEGRDGYGAERRVLQATDEAQAPRTLFSDGTQLVVLADMTGDGLQDLVRVRGSSLCYWPNLGYGRFGPKVEMAGAPAWGRRFDPSRVRLTDIDGSGTADVVYLGAEGVTVAFNRSGNLLEAGGTLLPLRVDDATTVDTVDLLGDGTACLVWSQPGRPMRYLRLMAEGKPHVLTQTSNGQGQETRLSYAPSTAFYVRDRDAGRPWATMLPFPVQCLERVEVIDQIREHRLVTRYACHHGFYDGVEREFRGFGSVEQWDSEAFFDLAAPSEPDATWSPPSRRQTWFHTGAFFEAGSLLTRYQTEWFHEDGTGLETPPPSDVPATLAKLPADLTPTELREAHRALRGQAVRSELWAVGGTTPFTVTTTAPEVREVQPRHGDRPAVFMTWTRESVTHAWDEQPHDPRITQQVVLEVDAFGTPLRSLAWTYPRRAPEGTDTRHDEQKRAWAAVSESTFAHQTSVPYRLAVPTSRQMWEVGGTLSASVAQGELLTWEALADALTSPTRVRPDAALDALEVGSDLSLALRLMGHQVLRYDDDGSPRAFGELGPQTLLHDMLSLAMTDEQLDAHLAPAAGWTTVASRAPLLEEGGYVELATWDTSVPDTVAGDAWARSAVSTWNGPFQQSDTNTSPFGTLTTVTWADHGLFPTAVTTELSPGVAHTVTATVDPWTLQPLTVTDINGNLSQARYDALGRVVATAVVGNPSLTGVDLDDLGAGYPTEVFSYTFATSTTPASASRWARRQHSGGTGPTGRGSLDNPAWDVLEADESTVWFDGLGRPMMTKAKSCDEEGVAAWQGTGRVVLDAKGQPIKQYEPFYTTEAGWQDDEAVRAGAFTTLYYDAVGRVTSTRGFDGSEATVSRTPWSETHHDAIDTLTADHAWWDSALGSSVTTGEKTHILDHLADTPTTVHVDALGRPFLEQRTLDRPATGDPDLTQVRVVLDLQGRATRVLAEHWVRDEAGFADAFVTQTLTEDTFDVAGRSLVHLSQDSRTLVETSPGTFAAKGGITRALAAIDGQPLRVWSREEDDEGRGRIVRMTHDALRRTTGTWVTDTTETTPIERLVTHATWGEDFPPVSGESDSVRLRNLMGRPWQVHDPAGTVEVVYDHAGRPTSSTRTFVEDGTSQPDWSGLLTSSTTPTLESSGHTETLAYDAAGRVVEATTPDDTKEVRTYDLGGRLQSVTTYVRGSTTPTPVLHDQTYNARNQRARSRFGNDGGASTMETVWSYDPATFRVTSITTDGAPDTGEWLQDLSYRYDAVGNILAIADAAQTDLWWDNLLTTSTRTFTYDALYRLVEATGREHADMRSDLGGDVGQFGDRAFQIGDATALTPYTQTYAYDGIGNLLRMSHFADSTWRHRYYTYLRDGTGRWNNQLYRTWHSGDDVSDVSTWTDSYAHDAHGNMTALPGVIDLEWDVLDRLAGVGAAGIGEDDRWYYQYDAGGQRVRKTRVAGSTVLAERRYVGGWERYREWDGSGVQDDRETRHVADDQRRVAMIEHVSVEDGTTVSRTVWRYQLDDHLGTACLEVTELGAVISYEEYHPYGTTAYRAQDASKGVSLKRYRFTGMERDEESGLAYHSARYYAPWLGRWTAADPIGLGGGANAFGYCSGGPVGLSDRNGTAEVDGSSTEEWKAPTLDEHGWSQGRVLSDDDGIIVETRPVNPNCPNILGLTTFESPETSPSCIVLPESLSRELTKLDRASQEKEMYEGKFQTRERWEEIVSVDGSEMKFGPTIVGDHNSVSPEQHYWDYFRSRLGEIHTHPVFSEVYTDQKIPDRAVTSAEDLSRLTQAEWTAVVSDSRVTLVVQTKAFVDLIGWVPFNGQHVANAILEEGDNDTPRPSLMRIAVKFHFVVYEGVLGKPLMRTSP